MNQEEAKQFLRGLGLTVSEGVVRKVLLALPHILHGERGYSLYEFYHGRRGGKRILAKPTAYKIMRLYKAGELKPYVDYLTSGGQPEVDVERGNSEHTSYRPPSAPLQGGVYRGPMRQSFPLISLPAGDIPKAMASYIDYLRTLAYPHYMLKAKDRERGAYMDLVIRAIRQVDPRLPQLEQEFREAAIERKEEARQILRDIEAVLQEHVHL